ncbi:hypothetical protein BsWGS_22975 [Bradybaena similaris]
MLALRVCACLAFIGVLRADVQNYNHVSNSNPELSQLLREYLCVFNGLYTDQRQVAHDDSHHTPATLKIVPVYSPALSQNPVLYFEQTDNGAVVRSEAAIHREGDSNTVYMHPMNISGNKVTKPGTFDPRVLENITTDQLTGRADCEVSYRRVAPCIFFMDFPDCKLDPVNGRRPTYDATFNCNTATIVVPSGAEENASPTPYILNLEGDKNPVPGAAGRFVCECGKSGGCVRQP